MKYETFKLFIYNFGFIRTIKNKKKKIYKKFLISYQNTTVAVYGQKEYSKILYSVKNLETVIFSFCSEMAEGLAIRIYIPHLLLLRDHSSITSSKRWGGGLDK